LRRFATGNVSIWVFAFKRGHHNKPTKLCMPKEPTQVSFSCRSQTNCLTR